MGEEELRAAAGAYTGLCGRGQAQVQRRRVRCEAEDAGDGEREGRGFSWALKWTSNGPFSLSLFS